MRRETIALLHPTGQHYRYVTRAEGERLVDQRQAVRLRPKKALVRYRLIEIPEPSDSKDDSPCLTRYDMAAVVGLASRGAFYKSRSRVRAWQPSIRCVEATV
jgi:hypothetical protein